MTQYLPPNLLALFAPREPIPFLPPTLRLPHERKTKGYIGVGQYMNLFEDPKDTPPPLKIETKEERLERRKREKAEKSAYIREQGIALWDPHNNASATHDPYKTLFIARICSDLSESRLKKEFEAYGPIRKISMINDKISGKFKGYAFVEYENEKDMHAAYKHADGKKLEGRRVLVDVERGRTVKGWLPRRLGGGLSDKPKVFREEREERPTRGGGGDRFERRDRDRDRDRFHRSSSRDRRDYRRKRSRSRERDRSDRDRGRDRDRARDRSDRDRAERRERHDRGFEDYSVSRGYNENHDGHGKRHRSRSRERKRYARSSRSRSGSPRAERKRARSGFEGNGDRHFSAYPPAPPPDQGGELEEGEDRSGYADYGADENYVYIKKEPVDYESDEYPNSQPGFAGYKD